jgi:serine/threonine protein kinase
LIQNKNNSNNLIRKKSEIILHKIKREKEKEKNLEKNKEIIDVKDMVYGHKIHWKKINLIKEGENSFIYKAFNTSNGHVFIVKEYKGNYMKLFYREAKYLKKNKHKNMVGFIDAEVVNNDSNSNINYYYIYLNYIGGYSLKEFYSKVGFFTKQLLKKLIEQIIFFVDDIKSKGLFYNNFNFNHIFFDLDGNIKLIDFSKIEKQKEMIKTNFIRHGDDLDFASFKNMILHVIYYEKNNKGNNIENSNDVISFCNFLEVNLINANNFFEFKNNYFLGEYKDKEESIFLKNSSVNPSIDLLLQN